MFHVEHLDKKIVMNNMKPLMVYQAPIFTRSGYGDHARDILLSIRKLDKFDIKLVPTRWGNTPQNVIPTGEFGQWMLNNIVTSVSRQPDVFIQMSVPNEFQPRGKVNIGITAGTETNIAPREFIEGCDRMDRIIVPSEFTKRVLVDTAYEQKDSRTGQLLKTIRLTKPVHVIHEGVNLDIFSKPRDYVDLLSDVKTDFNYLFVGHWLKGDLGEDRKDIGMMIKTFCSVFKNIPQERQPGLILKTSKATFSLITRNSIIKNIETVTEEFGDKCPPIYLVWGDLAEDEMSSLYHNDKVKAMISFTKGEGYGRPLAEFAVTGKPILASKWSGHLDFLDDRYAILLDGSLKKVHPSAADDKFIIKESSWFTVDYTNAAKHIMDVWKNYPSNLKRSNGFKVHMRNKFSMSQMDSIVANFFDLLNIQAPPQHVPLALPKLQKVNPSGSSVGNLPKLNLPRLQR